MKNITNSDAADLVLAALGEQLDAAGERVELVIVGGSGLLAIGAIERPTSDVDVVAIRSEGGLESADPLPDAVIAARDLVARDLGLPEDWLNPGPTKLLDFGLPQGFEERLTARTYGPSLTAHFAARTDQIHLKLYALVDQGPGKHESDLRALEPIAEELLAAAEWTRTHDPSPGFDQQLRRVLEHLGVGDVG